MNLDLSDTNKDKPLEWDLPRSHQIDQIITPFWSQGFEIELQPHFVPSYTRNTDYYFSWPPQCWRVGNGKLKCHKTCCSCWDCFIFCFVFWLNALKITASTPLVSRALRKLILTIFASFSPWLLWRENFGILVLILPFLLITQSWHFWVLVRYFVKSPLSGICLIFFSHD